MALFRIEKKSLKQIKEIRFDLERDIQQLVEQNLSEILNLKFVSSEYQLHALRIDTLAFDTEKKSFVIIEYKKDKSQSVIDQGFSYLALMLNNKAEFILQYNECMNEVIKRDDIDWEQSKIIFISNNFTTYQKSAIEFKDLPIELWEAKKYDNELILFNEIKATDAKESIKTITKDKTIQTVSKEIKKYSVEDHFGDDWDEAWSIYQKLRDRILEIDQRIVESPQKSYIGFKIGNSNLCGVHIYKSKVVIAIGRSRPTDLNDPDKKLVYRKNSFEHYNQHISDYVIEKDSEIDYGIFLLRQNCEKFFK